MMASIGLLMSAIPETANLLPKLHRLSRTQQSVTFSGPELFNSLPENIRSITSPSILKMKLKTYFIDQYA